MSRPAVCTSPPQPGKPCAPPSQQPGVLEQVRDFFQKQTERLSPSLPPILAKPQSASQQQRRTEMAQQYMAARIAGQKEAVLNLVTEDIKLESSRDGQIVGKHAFSSYLDRVKPIGTWSDAVWNTETNQVEIEGNVRFLMVPVGVIAQFDFKQDKISKIYVGTRRRKQL